MVSKEKEGMVIEGKLRGVNENGVKDGSERGVNESGVNEKSAAALFAPLLPPPPTSKVRQV